MPERVQRKRVKGWTMPENTVYVGRPSIYANPFTIGRDRLLPPGQQWIVRWWPGGPVHSFQPHEMAAKRTAVDCFEDWLSQETLDPSIWHNELIVRHIVLKAALDRGDLAGHDLACWCKYEPCHVTPLIRLANPTPEGEQQ